MDIFISGIPKGLDPFSVSQHIKQSVETVAQVQDIWVHPTKGYGFITLVDATSTSSALVLNNHISINGGIVKLRRNQTYNVKKSVRSPRPIDAFVQPTYSGGGQSCIQSKYTSDGGYTTYEDYRRDRPCPDTLYNHVQQVPTRRKKRKQPWKDVTRRAAIPTPKSGSTGKIRKRPTRGRKNAKSRKNKDSPPKEVHTSKRKLCRSTCNKETTTKSLPLNQNDSENNQQPVNPTGLKKTQLLTDAVEDHLIKNHSRPEDIKPINNVYLDPIIRATTCLGDIKPITNILSDPIIVGHLASEEIKPTESLLMDPLTLDHPGVRDIYSTKKVPSEQLVVDHQDTGDNHSITNIPMSHEEVDQDAEPIEFGKRNLITSDAPLCHTPRENFFDQPDCMGTDENDVPLNLVNVHLYDHSKYLCSANIKNKSVIESLGEIIWKRCKIPPKSYILIYNGKVLNQTFIPIIESGANIHIVVKGKGGMNEGDSPVTRQEVTRTNSTIDISTGNLGANFRPEVDNVSPEEDCPSTVLQYRTMQHAVVKALGLEEYFPNKLTRAEVMCIVDDEERKPATLQDFPLAIVRKIIMLDKEGRDEIFSGFYCDDDSDDDTSDEDDDHDRESIGANFTEKIVSKELKLHPIDIFITIYLCLHPMLQQHVCTKMAICHLAVPFMYRQSTADKCLMISLWPFREIIVRNRERDISIVNCKQHVISFIRLGRPSISKSSIANMLLGFNNHPTFLSRDCTLGDTKKRVSEGLVEAAWFIPSGKATNQELNDTAMVLNLRGNAFENPQQMTYLKEISDVLIVIVDESILHDVTMLDGLKCIKSDIIFLVSDRMAQGTRNDIKRHMQPLMQDRRSVHFVNALKNGSLIGTDRLKTSVLKTINSCLNTRASVRTVLHICQLGSEMKYDVDEYSVLFQSAKGKASELLDTIDEIPLEKVTERTLKLQNDLWKNFIVEKRKLKKEKCMLLNAKDKLIMKIRELEKSLREERTSKFMEIFIHYLTILHDDELVYFLEFLKIDLDEKFRKLRVDIKNRWKSSLTNAKDDTEKACKDLEMKLSKASFGIEHMLREIGHMIEIGGPFVQGKKVAHSIAKLILSGFPFEIMDGDATNIPLKWVKSVFDELYKLIGNGRVFTMSTIGLQSSGKSTLLNAMFGASFPVSAGKCTRGIYMQLFPVSKGTFKFDYVLVFDTEGLRAPEGEKNNYHRDNELATLAVGMADLSLINIKGENTSEVHDILQVCVHAFLQLEQANAKLCLDQSCIFTHQNVSATNDDGALLQQRIKLEDTLNKMTEEAAQEEKDCSIKHFSDVIGFNWQDDIWYFPDLWMGVYPMILVNPDYSRYVQTVKSHILQTKTIQMKAHFKNVLDLFQHLNDLWDGILLHDFVFSFRDTKKLKAYKALEKCFKDIQFQLDYFVNDRDNIARVSLQKCSSSCQLDAEFDVIKQKHQYDLRKTTDELKLKLDNYFENGEYKDDINKWRDDQMMNWNLATRRAEDKMMDILNTVYVEKQDEFKMEGLLGKIKINLTKEAKMLAADILATKSSGGGEDVKVKEDRFEKMWQNAIGKLNLQEERSTDIKGCVYMQLMNEFKDKTSVENELDNLHHRSLDISDVISWFPIDTTLVKVSKLDRFLNIVKPKNYSHVIRPFTEGLLAHVKTKFDSLQQTESKCDVMVIQKLLDDIRDKVEHYNSTQIDNITFTETYITRVAVIVCSCAIPLLKRLDSEYKEKHSVRAQLDAHKEQVFRQFIDLTNQSESVMVACNVVCNAIRPYICTYIQKKLQLKINIETLMICCSKEILLVKIMTYLAETNSFHAYLTYIQDPRMYALDWLKNIVNDKCFTKPVRLYYISAKSLMENLFSQIRNCVNSDKNEVMTLKDCLFDFSKKINLIMPVKQFSLDQLDDQNEIDISVFASTLIEGTEEMHKELEKKFSDETEFTIKWSGQTPYEMVLDVIWGCDSSCPFCLEPCILDRDHQSMVPHRCMQHRPQGVIGTFWTEASKLVVENCNTEVGNRFSSYMCGRICTRGPPEPHENGIVQKLFVWFKVNRRKHLYKNYKHFFPDWDIVPHSDISNSVYWAWVLCQYNSNFSDYYDLQKADIPESWTVYTKEDAIRSLPSLDTL